MLTVSEVYKITKNSTPEKTQATPRFFIKKSDVNRICNDYLFRKHLLHDSNSEEIFVGVLDNGSKLFLDTKVFMLLDMYGYLGGNQ
jgi:hypothetical protein